MTRHRKPDHPRAARKSRFWLLLAAVWLGAVSAGAAQDNPPAAPELVSDRPDQTESSRVVPPGYVQLEAGWTRTVEGHGSRRTRSHQFPGTLVRLGTIPGMEFRLGWEGLAREGSSPEGAGSWGSGDLSAGLKVALRPEEGWAPRMALLAGTTLPTGTDGFSSQRPDPSVRLSLSHSLSDRVGLGYNIGAAWESVPEGEEDRDTFAAMNYTAGLGISLHERLSVFIEAFGEAPLNGPARPGHFLDGGLTVLVRENLQLDVSAGRGLSKASEGWFLGAGVVLLSKW